MILTVALFNAPLTFSQIAIDYVQVIAYGTDVEQTTTAISFIAATPPAGSEIPNLITMMQYGSDENYTRNLLAGDVVAVIHADRDILNLTTTAASEPNHFTIVFEGGVEWMTVNSAEIPEFPTFIVIPLFIIATLLAIIYEKRTSHSKLTD